MVKLFQFHFQLRNFNLVTFRKFHIKEKNISVFKRRKTIENLTEAQIIELAKKDSYYFGTLYNNYFDKIFRFVFKRLGGNEDSAADITQQTFMKAMANLYKYEDRGLPFSSWLYRIAQNEVNMHFRNQQSVVKVVIEERMFKNMCEEANIGNYMSQEQQEKLINLLNEIEQEHLDLIELRYFQGLSFKEIADIYSITEANAKMRVYRILEKLNKKWEELS
jgi:RNA polymerase sigma-70 factor (ECF subfamily)